MMLPAVEQLNSNFGLLAGVGCIYSHAELKDKTKTQRENPFVSQSMENQLHQLQMKKKKKKSKSSHTLRTSRMKGIGLLLQWTFQSIAFLVRFVFLNNLEPRMKIPKIHGSKRFFFV